MASSEEMKKPAAQSVHKPLDYNRFDNLDFSSDSDDCHPNIEIGTWRRLKEKMRREKGLKKREPDIRDKWNTTSINPKNKIDVTKKPETSENLSEESKNPPKTNTESSQSEEKKQEEKQEEKPAKISKTQETKKIDKKDTKEKQKKKDDEDSIYNARSDPQAFLDANMQLLKEFANIKKQPKADKFIQKNFDIVHEAAEGYLITYAVDRAVEGAEDKELRRLARRCLMVHNLVQSCSQANISPEKGVQLFYSRLSNDKIAKEYDAELTKQVDELMLRIYDRKKERLAEAEEEIEYEEVQAPIGPGGLDPTEVLNSLPKEMQEAFVEQDIPKLKEVLGSMPEEEAAYHMDRCVKAGLWVSNADDTEQNQENKQNEQNQDASKEE